MLLVQKDTCSNVYRGVISANWASGMMLVLKIDSFLYM
jgi:hypothetical protein